MKADWEWARTPGEAEPGRSSVFNAQDPHPARTYAFLLGGKDNFAADRELMRQAEEVAPGARERIRECRAFMRRVVRFLAEAGVRQFLDIGSGLPTEQGNVHQVAQGVAPETRVVYVDNDPMVLVHARALLALDEQTAAVAGDLAEPEAILTAASTEGGIDFTQPVAVLLLSVLHFVRDEQDPSAIVARLRDALAPGSYLAVAHVTSDLDQSQDVARLFDHAALAMVPRGRAQIEAFFDGFELVEPGLVPVELWRPDSLPGRTLSYGGVGRKD